MRKILFFILSISSYFSASAQQIFLDSAVYYYQNSKLPEAKAQIEKAVNDAQTINNPYAWYFRGVIYKEIYKQNRPADSLLTLRIEAANSFTKSIELDTNKEYEAENLKNLRFLGVTFFNDANLKLKEQKFELSQKCFNLYKPTMKLADPLMNIKEMEIEFKEMEIEYYLSVASTYNKIYNKRDDKLVEYLDKAKDTYNKVIKIDPENLLANYNMGIIYYNQAVKIIRSLEVTLDILAFREAEDEVIELFKKSLPYIETGYQLAPDDKNIVEALYEIYYSLNDEENFEEFKKKLDDLNKN